MRSKLDSWSWANYMHWNDNSSAVARRAGVGSQRHGWKSDRGKQSERFRTSQICCRHELGQSFVD